jgi:hypothetical protein
MDCKAAELRKNDIERPQTTCRITDFIEHKPFAIMRGAAGAPGSSSLSLGSERPAAKETQCDCQEKNFQEISRKKIAFGEKHTLTHE